MMGIIKTDEQYEEALALVEELMDLNPEPGTGDADKLELLILLISNYEKEHFPMKMPDPIEAIKFRMEQQQLSQKDLIPFIGSRSRVSEVLNRKRPLTLKMIRHLYKGLGIPAEVLIQEPGTVGNGKLIRSNKEFPGAKKVASPKARYDRTS
ncbi:MAG: transcriptional regulator [Candidatus Aminicenantes bacterium]|nr:MAG: transcriptional regulator [Candidatus Aminicenantes bacterium]